jgi:hypothetical protein
LNPLTTDKSTRHRVTAACKLKVWYGAGEDMNSLFSDLIYSQKKLCFWIVDPIGSRAVVFKRTIPLPTTKSKVRFLDQKKYQNSRNIFKMLYYHKIHSYWVMLKNIFLWDHNTFHSKVLNDSEERGRILRVICVVTFFHKLTCPLTLTIY